MTKEEIMRMAEASGVEDSLLYEHWRCNLESMTKFAALVASAEREACANLCTELAPSIKTMTAYKVLHEASKAIKSRGQE